MNRIGALRCAVVGALLVGAMVGCAGQASPLGPAPPSGKQVPPIETITPQYSKLPVDPGTDPVETLPWRLIEVDREENRIYLSASTTDCRNPGRVRVSESMTEIRITVTAVGGKEPCSMQYLTMIGYVQFDDIGDRQVVGTD